MNEGACTSGDRCALSGRGRLHPGDNPRGGALCRVHRVCAEHLPALPLPRQAEPAVAHGDSARLHNRATRRAGEVSERGPGKAADACRAENPLASWELVRASLDGRFLQGGSEAQRLKRDFTFGSWAQRASEFVEVPPWLLHFGC